MSAAPRQTAKRIDRAQGCLVGLAIGDALGSSLEFLDPKQIQAQFGVHRELSGEGWLRLQPGEVTDETQMAKILAESLLAKRQFDVQDLAKRLVKWLQGKPRDLSAADREGIGRIAAGVPPLESGMSDELGSGNTAVARGVALGIRYHKEREALRAYSLEQSCLTHLHAESRWASYLVNSMIAFLLDGYSLAEMRRLTKSEFRESPPSILKALVEPMDLGKPSSYVGESLQVVLYDLFQHKDFESTLVAVVNRGGDSDATGAIAGAIAGAHYGLSGIPDRWVEAVQWSQELSKLGKALCEAADSERRKR